LPAIRLGPRILRIRTADALQFERLAKMHRPANRASEPGDQRPKRRAQVRQR
jgi:hypothetical protein